MKASSRPAACIVLCVLALAMDAPVDAAERNIEAQAAGLLRSYDKRSVPGCAVGVFQNGQTLVSRGFGMADVETGRPIDGDTIFNFASTSKQFTALLAAMLIVDGRLSLQDDIRQWIPEIPDYGIPITIDMLMHHTSGLRDYLNVTSWTGHENHEDLDRPHALQVITRQKAPNFQPGQYYSYSNTNYFLLAEVVQRVSGQPFEAFAEKRIFAPLGMTHSYFRPRKPPAERAAQGYQRGPHGMERNDHEPGVSGDGGLASSINDLAKFDRDFHAGTSAKVWKPEVFHILHAPGSTRDGAKIVLSDSGSMHYGGGLVIGQLQGQEWIVHAGSVAGFRSQYIRLPQLKLGVAVLCNRSDADPGTLAIEIVKTVARDELKGKTPKSKPAGLDPFAVPKGSALPLSTAKDISGAYRSDDVGARFDITCRGSALELALVWEGTGRKDNIVIKDLKQAGKDKLVQSQMGFILQLERNDHGVVSGFTYSEQRARGLRFARISK